MNKTPATTIKPKGKYRHGRFRYEPFNQKNLREEVGDGLDSDCHFNEDHDSFRVNVKDQDIKYLSRILNCLYRNEYYVRCHQANRNGIHTIKYSKKPFNIIPKTALEVRGVQNA